MSPLAVALHDGSSVVYHHDGARWSAVRTSRGYWPAWRPFHAQLLLSAVERGDAGGRASLRLIEAASGLGLDVPGSVSAPARLIADRLGHYATWNRDGSAVCYVAPAGRTLAARVWRPGESGEQTLTGGAPIFPSWSPDGRHLALHHGSSLTLVDAATLEQRRVSENASGFRTAAFLDGGREVVFAEPADNGVVLKFASTDDSTAVREGPPAKGGVAFCPNPVDGRLAVAVTPGDEAGVFSHVELIDGGSETGSPFLKGPFLGFWWAPTGDRFAVLVPAYTGDGRFQVRFHRSDGSFERAMEPTTLSQDMRTLVSFFDQYTVSHALWSAEGRYFSMAGRLTGEGPHASFWDGPLDRVYLADAQLGGPWQAIGEGTGGFFPP